MSAPQRDSRGRFTGKGGGGKFPIDLDVDVVSVNALTEGWRTRGTDLSPITGPISEELPGVLRANIDAGQFAPLSELYAKRKGKKYPGKPILRASDRLYGSFHPSHDQSVAEAFTDVEYAAPLDKGSTRMPARLFAYLPEPTIETAKNRIAGYVVGGGS